MVDEHRSVTGHGSTQYIPQFHQGANNPISNWHLHLEQRLGMHTALNLLHGMPFKYKNDFVFS
jgi:hypothetical protein